MNISDRIRELTQDLPQGVGLVAVSKFHPTEALMEAYAAGQRLFGESRVQELVAKYEALPKDIEWHFIGHLQQNKVKQLVPFVAMIQSVDSLRLLQEIDKQAAKVGRRIPVLLQVHIAQEEHKFGFSLEELETLLSDGETMAALPNIEVQGLMGMATFTDDETLIRSEFTSLKNAFDRLKASYFVHQPTFRELSMGMTDDYRLAIDCGSTMVRIGSKIFGSRQ